MTSSQLSIRNPSDIMSSLNPVLPNGEKVEDEPISQADYEALRNAMPTWRDTLLCKFLRGSGLRIAEALALTPNKFGTEGPDVFVLAKRGKKKTGEREWAKIYLQPLLARELLHYIQGENMQPDQRVFPISDRQVRYIFHDAGMKILGHTAHPHQLRFLYSKELIDGGVPLAAASKMLGHADTRTTEKHYYDLTTEQRKAIQLRVHI